MPRRAGDGLRQHAPLAVEDARRDVPAFAHDGAEGRAHQRLSLFLDHRQKAGPHDLKPGLGEGHGVALHHDVAARVDERGEIGAEKGGGLRLHDQGGAFERVAGGKERAVVDGGLTGRAGEVAGDGALPVGSGPVRDGGDRVGLRRGGEATERPQLRTSIVMSGTGRLNWRAYSASKAARIFGEVGVGQVAGGSGISISWPCPW
jgi:hypothetical protein